jgi:hypothetical protein
MSAFVSRNSQLAAALAVAMVASQAAHAASWDRFDGAWVAEGGDCKTIFKTRGGKPAFSKRAGISMPGFIVQSDQVRGLNSQCTIASRKEDGDTMKILLHCRSPLMFGDMPATIKIKDDDTIIRVDPDFPEIQTTYNRCK